MADTGEQFTIGAAVSGADGPIGKLTRVVVDPVARAVTHLVVEPSQRGESSRLVPLGLVEDAAVDEIGLSCGTAAFEQLDPAEETQFLAGPAPGDPYGPGEVGTWQYYSLSVEPQAFGPGGLGSVALPPVVTDEKVPPGEVSVRRGDRVHATDGEIGRIQGLVIDPGDRRVTHVLLQEGHLWGRREVAIPASAVTGVDDDGIKLALSRQEVQDLPPVGAELPRTSAE